MKIDLESQLRALGRQQLAACEPMTTAEVLLLVDGQRLDEFPEADVPLNVVPIDQPRPRPIWRRAMVPSIAAATVLVAGLGVALAALNDSDDPAAGTVTSPDPSIPVPVGEPSDPPRLLMGDDWIISWVDEFPIDGYVSGQLQFDATVEENLSVSVQYRPEDQLGTEPTPGGVDVGTASLLGTDASIVYFPDGIDATFDAAATTLAGVEETQPPVDTSNCAEFDNCPPGPADHLTFEATALVDGYVVAVTGGGRITQIEFADAVRSLRAVEEPEWEAALPDEIVAPSERQATVEEFLTGVSLPSGLDVQMIAADPVVTDQLNYGTRVGNQVVCAWLDEWFADDASAVDAEEALATVHDWPAYAPMAEQTEPAAFAVVEAVLGDGTVDLPEFGLQGAITIEDLGPVLGCGYV